MTNAYSFLIASGNRQNTELLNECIYELNNQFKVLSARDAFSALNIIKSEFPSVVIIENDLITTENANFIKKIRADKLLNKIYIISLITQSESDNFKELLNDGADDILILPLNRKDIYLTLSQAIKLLESRNQLNEINSLLSELADELRKNIEETKLLALKFQEIKIPSSLELSTRIAKASVWIANELGDSDEDSIHDIETAAMLSFIGKLSLPDDLINNPVHQNGLPTHKFMYQVPITANQILSKITRFSSVSQILYHLYENLDGSGFPDKLRLWQIPLGSRIIRVVQDYEVIRQNTSRQPKDILSILRNDIRRLYDHRIVVLHEQYIKSIIKEDYDPNEIAINLKDLKDGMILTQDIITNVGLKLLSAGVKLNRHHIDTIISHNTTDPIIGRIFVRK